MLGRRRKREAICDSFFLTVVVITILLVTIVYYRNDLAKLLRTTFVVFVLFGAFLFLRHSYYRVAYRFKATVGSTRNATEHEEIPENRLDWDEERERTRRRLQQKHKEKAEEFERTVAGPRRDRKLREQEEKLRSFRGEGHVIGGQPGGVSVLLDSGSSSSVGDTHETHVTSPLESCDSHVTDEEEDEEATGSDGGRKIHLALKLPRKVVKKEFYTKNKIKALYKWLKVLGYSSKDYCISTGYPRQLLIDQSRTLEDCGITTDTSLLLEEREAE